MTAISERFDNDIKGQIPPPPSDILRYQMPNPSPLSNDNVIYVQPFGFLIFFFYY